MTEKQRGTMAALMIAVGDRVKIVAQTGDWEKAALLWSDYQPRLTFNIMQGQIGSEGTVQSVRDGFVQVHIFGYLGTYFFPYESLQWLGPGNSD